MKWLSGMAVILSALAMVWLLQFVFGERPLFDRQLEMLLGPALGLGAVGMAVVSYRAISPPSFFRGLAVLLSGLVVMMWLGVDVLSWVTHSQG